MQGSSSAGAGEREQHPRRGDSGEEREEAILEARARELARLDPPVPENLVLVLTFAAGDEQYAVALERVLRVERVERVTRVPYATRGVVGLFNLHGKPCALLDVPALLADAEPQPRRWAVVLGRRHAELALAADDVEAGQIESPPPQPAPFQLGLTPDARILLDVDALLEAPGDAASPRGGAA